MSLVTSVEDSQLIRITNGTNNGKMISGVFKYIDSKNEGYGVEILVVINTGEHVWIKLNDLSKAELLTVGEVNDAPSININSNSKLSEEQVEFIINERFDVMGELICSLRVSDIKSVIITGAAGIGKTWNIEEYLTKVELEEGQHWGSIGGKCSAFGLYEALYEYRNEGSILVMDDVNVFEDETQINLLKKALDTSSRRFIDWRSGGKLLDEKGIPNSFEFKGKIVFLTNTNIYAEINAFTKRAPHLNALISRSVTLDLGIHDVKTILIHVRSVMRKSNMLVKRGLTNWQQEQVISWLENNRDNLTALSLRTPLMVGEYIKTNPESWETMCRHTLLRPVALSY